MIRIICFGKIKEKYLNDLINDYRKRISKYHKIEILELKDDNNILVEEKELLNVLKKSDYNIYLDINGKEYDSVGLAKLIDGLFNHYPCINFIIGGSNGVTSKIKDFCNERISFSRFTMPHGLFRGVLLEQIYRSMKINNNESYHK